MSRGFPKNHWGVRERPRGARARIFVTKPTKAPVFGGTLQEDGGVGGGGEGAKEWLDEAEES